MIAMILLLSFCTTFYLVRKTIWISHKTGLYDHPSEARKIHTDSTPHLGGAAIFVSFLGLSAVFPVIQDLPDANALYLSTGFLFLTGIGDDLAGMNPYKKLLAQVISATALAMHPAYRLTQLQDILGIGVLDGIPSFMITVLFILAAVNAFNLIDGINCLSSGLALSGFTFLAYGFHLLQQPALLTLCAILFGGLLAFILHNRTPARIFLGDSGSLVLGFLIAACTIRLIESRSLSTIGIDGGFHERAPMLAMAIFFVPFLDMTRVFLLRLIQRRSPFAADRSHIHHRLLDSGMTHMQASALLVGFSFLAQVMAIAIPGLTLVPFLALLISAAGFGFWLLRWTFLNADISKTAVMTKWRAEELINPALGGPYPQFIKYLIAGRDLDKKYQSKKMKKVP